MARVAPFHSSHPNTTHYHNNSKCGPGSEIPRHNRKSGSGNKKLCEQCAKLNSEGK